MGPITDIVPDPLVLEVENSGGNNDGVCDTGEICETNQPATTSASVVYSPEDVNAHLADSFEFEVDDGMGGADTATVSINPGNVAGGVTADDTGPGTVFGGEV